MEIFGEYMKNLYQRLKDIEERIVVCSEEGEILFITKALKKDMRELAPRTVSELFGSKVQKQLLDSFNMGLPISINTMFKFKRQILSMAPGQGCMIIRIQELRKDNSDLTETDAVSLVEHEVRCALSSMSACVDYLKKFIPSATEDETIHKNLSIINKGIYRVVRVVGAVTDISRYNRDDLLMDYDVRNLTDSINTVVDKISHVFEKHNILFIKELPKAEIITIFDAEKIQRMLYNIFNNACKAKNSNNNSVYMGVSIENKNVCIRIKYGISEKVIASPLYEPTVRFALASNIAKLHNGEITIKNNNNQEMDILVTMPIRVKMDSDIILACNTLQYVAGFDTFKLEMSDELDSDEF